MNILILHYKRYCSNAIVENDLSVRKNVCLGQSGCEMWVSNVLTQNRDTARDGGAVNKGCKA